ncbi:hypothetical protein [Amycolatopsis samaneae]|uniref:DUF2637 domain-containing protein n=1 Tax=Amycolatopsis samaneae TaxID=664691 RepID=A0ABW5GUH1_9PSEU
MANNRTGRGGCALVLLAVFGGLPLTMVLAAPAIAAHIVLGGAPTMLPYLREWQWAMIGSLLLALVLVRMVLDRKGRLRGRSVPPAKRWLGVLARAGLLLGVVNALALLQLTRSGRTDHVITGSIWPFVLDALAGIAVLVAIARWDRRPEPVTIEEIRAATTEADRALRRVRAENERVRRQAEQVQARLAKLRTPTTGPANGRAKGKPADRHSNGIDVGFHSLRICHRESYQCADTAHLAYQSAQSSVRTMSHLVRRARLAPRQWVPTGRAGRRARAELRAAAAHLTRSHDELRARVGEGLTMVRTLNSNTADLKHEIRDSCGRPGRLWFEALEERVAERRAHRTG